MEKINYNLLFEKEIEKNVKLGIKPSLLLHVCCAPCSSGCLEKLVEFFNVKVLFYNPNISPQKEYEKRKIELKRFINENEKLKNVEMIDCDYEEEEFKKIAQGLEKVKEGGLRCEKCFRLRLFKTAIVCKKSNCDYFTTTLTISPLKNSALINQIGFEIANEIGIKFLPSDFKKKEGYKNSIINSEKFNLYRQDYCGCVYSRLEREEQKIRNNLQNNTNI